MFRGTVLEDLRPAFRADIVQLVSLPEASLSALVSVLCEDAKQSSPTRIDRLTAAIAKELRLPTEQSRSLARAGRSLSMQLVKTDDSPSDVADDLVFLGVVPEEKGKSINHFLDAVRRERSHFAGRASLTCPPKTSPFKS